MKITELVERAKLMSALATAAVVLSSCAAGSSGGGDNKLNVGYGVKAPDSVDLSAQLSGLMNYNGKSTEELLALRTKNAGAHPELLDGPYKPSAAVFQIDSKSPWWGLKGYLFRGKVSSSIDGSSRESPYFGNPYMLVSPEWYGNNMQWSDRRFPTPQAFADSYPAFLPPKSVKIFPTEKREEIVYDVMSYYNSVKAMLETNWTIADIGFDLNGYNAEDFGYNYIYVDPDKSQNLSKLPPEVIKIDQSIMLKHHESCAPACNDLDSSDGMKGFKIKNLPAKCRLMLWRNKPTSHLVPTDFTIDLVFN